MKFATSISLGLTLVAAALALPYQNLQKHCKEVQYTSLQCLDERQSGVMYRCAGGQVVDYLCPGDQVCVMFTFGQSTSAACSEKPPAPVKNPEHPSRGEEKSTHSTSMRADPSSAHIESTSAYSIQTSMTVESIPTYIPTSADVMATSSTVPAKSISSTSANPSVHSPCKCAPIEPSSSVYMNDFLITYQNQGYFWNVAARDANSQHRFDYRGVNAEGKGFSAIIVIEPKESLEAGLPLGARLYECFKKSEKIPSFNSEAVIASKCSLFVNNHEIASMEFSTK